LTANHLDAPSVDVGKFLIYRYLAKEGMFGLSQEDVPTIQSGPNDLVLRAKRGKSVTMKKITTRTTVARKSERELKEENRKKKVASQIKKINSMSSEANAAQALLKADCSKPKVSKAPGIQKALVDLLKKTLNIDAKRDDKIHQLLSVEGLVYLRQKMPQVVSQNVAVVTLEFAGVTFQESKEIHNGKQYMKAVEGKLKSLISDLP
jgi:hypothetical protein